MTYNSFRSNAFEKICKFHPVEPVPANKWTIDHMVHGVVKLMVSKILHRADGSTQHMELNLNVQENMLLLAFVVSTIKATVLRKLFLEFNAANSPKNLSDPEQFSKLK